MSILALVGSSSKIGRGLIHGLRDQIELVGVSRTPLNVEGIVNTVASTFEAKNFLPFINSDAIFYLVAQTSAPYGKDKFNEYLISNVYKLVTFLRAIDDYRGKIIFPSSAQVYHLSETPPELHHEDSLVLSDRLKEWVNETANALLNAENENVVDSIEFPQGVLDLGNGYSFIYELSKLVGEEIISRDERGVILRPSYCYGPSDSENVLAQLVQSFFDSGRISLTSEGKDFIHYGDLAQMIRNLIELKDPPKVVNVCSGNPTSPQFIVEQFQRYADSLNVDLEVNLKPAKRPSLQLSDSRFKSTFSSSGSLVEPISRGLEDLIFREITKRRFGREVISELKGGSVARVYRVGFGDDSSILKMALGPGAENGSLKIDAEARQTRIISEFLKIPSLFPQVLDHGVIGELGYCISSLAVGANFGQEIYEKQISNESLHEALIRLFQFVEKIYSESKISAPEPFFYYAYAGRVKRRLDSLRGVSETFNNLLDSDLIEINGTSYSNPLNLIDKVDSISPSELGLCLHGDLNLDNVFLNGSEFSFVDARGDVIWEEGLPYWDVVYDIAKVLFYVSGWKQLREEKFEVELNENRASLQLLSPQKEYFEGLQRFLIGIIPPQIIQQVTFATICHFLSDTFPRAVGNGSRSYDQALGSLLIGTKMLNNYFNDPNAYEKTLFWQ